MSPIVYFARTYPRQCVITVVCLMTAAVAEGLALATVVPLLALTMQPPEQVAQLDGTTAQIASYLSDALAAVGLPFTLASVAIAASAVIWLKAGLLLVSKRQVGNTVAWIATDLRLRMLRSFFAARWSYHTQHPIGRLTNAIGSEAARTAAAYSQLALAVQFTMLSVVGLSVAMVLSWKLALMTLAGWSVVGVGLNGLVRLAHRAGRKQTTVIITLLSRLTDALLNVKLIKTMGREKLIGPLLSHDTLRLQKAMRKQVLASESLKALQEPLMLGLLLAVLVYENATGQLRFEEVTVTLLALTRSLSGATKIQQRYLNSRTHSPALDSYLELAASADAAVEPQPSGRRPTLERGIELRDVSFAYGDAPVLEHADVEVRAGEITALVGGSGGGKTTISDLISGLIRPDSGSLFVDGVDLREIDLAQWRSMIGYVPQELVLMHDSVRTNVTLGDESISDARVEEALRAAGVWDVVEALPAGLDASVGERGSLLSGGQRARIALARALAPRPSLLILDEATAALDAATEAVVLETMKALRGSVTVLAISHQPALRQMADRVYRIDEGSVERLT